MQVEEGKNMLLLLFRIKPIVYIKLSAPHPFPHQFLHPESGPPFPTNSYIQRVAPLSPPIPTIQRVAPLSPPIPTIQREAPISCMIEIWYMGSGSNSMKGLRARVD